MAIPSPQTTEPTNQTQCPPKPTSSPLRVLCGLNKDSSGGGEKPQSAQRRYEVHGVGSSTQENTASLLHHHKAIAAGFVKFLLRPVEHLNPEILIRALLKQVNVVIAAFVHGSIYVYDCR